MMMMMMMKMKMKMQILFKLAHPVIDDYDDEDNKGECIF